MADGLPAASDIAATVAELGSDFSIEVTPSEVSRAPGVLRAVLPAGSRVYTTFLPGTPFSETLAAAAAVVDQGMRPVPHLAARSIPNERDLDTMVGSLADVGVTELLIIAGSPTDPPGCIGDSMQVLRTGTLARHGIRRVGVAGHPEGSVDIGADGLARALAEKNAFAREHGCDMYLLTQFCFDAQPILEWERTIRAAGNELPIHVGLPGLSSPVTLLKFGLSCGVGASLKVLRKQSGGVLKLATTPVYHPDHTIVGLARGVLADPQNKIVGTHFFPFGALERTAQWACGVRDGYFRIDTQTDRITMREHAPREWPPGFHTHRPSR